MMTMMRLQRTQFLPPCGLLLLRLGRPRPSAVCACVPQQGTYLHSVIITSRPALPPSFIANKGVGPRRSGTAGAFGGRIWALVVPIDAAGQKAKSGSPKGKRQQDMQSRGSSTRVRRSSRLASKGPTPPSTAPGGSAASVTDPISEDVRDTKVGVARPATQRAPRRLPRRARGEKDDQSDNAGKRDKKRKERPERDAPNAAAASVKPARNRVRSDNRQFASLVIVPPTWDKWLDSRDAVADEPETIENDAGINGLPDELLWAILGDAMNPLWCWVMARACTRWRGIVFAWAMAKTRTRDPDLLFLCKPLTTSLMYDVICSDNMAMAVWLRDKCGCPMGPWAFDAAGETQDYPRWVRWLRAARVPCPWSRDAMVKAAGPEHGFALIAWMRAQDPPCPWHPQVCREAAVSDAATLDRLMRAHPASHRPEPIVCDLTGMGQSQVDGSDGGGVSILGPSDGCALSRGEEGDDDVVAAARRCICRGDAVPRLGTSQAYAKQRPEKKTVERRQKLQARVPRHITLEEMTKLVTPQEYVPPMLSWLRAHDPPCPWDEETPRAVAWCASPADKVVLRWLREQDPPCPWDDDTTGALAWCGAGDTLAWALDNGAPCTARVPSNAASGAHMHVLEMLLERYGDARTKEGRALWTERVSESATLSREPRATLEWLRERAHCPWSAVVCDTLARHGRLETLKWCKANGCPWWRSSVCFAAATFADGTVLDWLCTHEDIVPARDLQEAAVAAIRRNDPAALAAICVRVTPMLDWTALRGMAETFKRARILAWLCGSQ